MNDNVEKESSALDAVLWIVVVAIVAAGVVGNSYYAEEVSVLYRALALIGMAGVAGALAYQTTKGQAFANLVKEAQVEMKKVVWPTRQETTQTTLIVVLVVFVMSLVLWGLDFILGKLISLVIG